ncbi:hypothetical protein C5C47_14060 [Rathayibacter rathayi]|nr:hypothetical protein C5C47_14060 [Rathayibacter rathayi]
MGDRRLTIEVIAESESLRVVDGLPSAEVLIRAARERAGGIESQDGRDALIAQLADRMEVMLLAFCDLENEERGWEYGVAEDAIAIERDVAVWLPSKEDAVEWMKTAIPGAQLRRRRPERHLPAGRWEPAPDAE